MMLFPNSAHGFGGDAPESAKWTFILRNLGMLQPAAQP
jgi:hypothetical protein